MIVDMEIHVNSSILYIDSCSFQSPPSDAKVGVRCNSDAPLATISYWSIRSNPYRPHREMVVYSPEFFSNWNLEIQPKEKNPVKVYVWGWCNRSWGCVKLATKIPSKTSMEH